MGSVCDKEIHGFSAKIDRKQGRRDLVRRERGVVNIDFAFPAPLRHLVLVEDVASNKVYHNALEKDGSACFICSERIRVDRERLCGALNFHDGFPSHLKVIKAPAHWVSGTERSSNAIIFATRIVVLAGISCVMGPGR